jgi:hypothetical protein
MQMNYSRKKWQRPSSLHRRSKVLEAQEPIDKSSAAERPSCVYFRLPPY